MLPAIANCVTGMRLSLLSRVRLFVMLWTVACQAPLPMGILQARLLEWVVAGRIKGVKYRVALQGGTWDFPGDTGNFGVPLELDRYVGELWGRIKGTTDRLYDYCKGF